MLYSTQRKRYTLVESTETDCMKQEMTRYGSSKYNIIEASSIIRARALALGINIKKVKADDLLAASVALDAWTYITKHDFTSRELRDLDPALAAIISRAAGHPLPTMLVTFRPSELNNDFKLAEEYAAWINSFDGIYAPEIFIKIASDLARGGSQFGPFAAIIESLGSNTY